MSSQVPESSILDPLRPELLKSKPFWLDGHEPAGVEQDEVFALRIGKFRVELFGSEESDWGTEGGSGRHEA